MSERSEQFETNSVPDRDTLRQERRAWELGPYLATRPYKDDRGQVHAPQTGEIVDPDQYFDSRRWGVTLEEGKSTQPYEAMSTEELSAKMAQAVFDVNRMYTIITRRHNGAGEVAELEVLGAPGTIIPLKTTKEHEARKPVAEKREAKFAKIYYEPDETGRAQTAYEVTRTGCAVNLPDLHGGNALLATDSTTYYVKGALIIDLTRIRNPRAGEPQGWNFKATEELPMVTVGNALFAKDKVEDETGSGPIKVIVIQQREEKADELGNEWQARQGCPFRQAEHMLLEAGLEVGEEGNEMTDGAAETTTSRPEQEAPAVDERPDAPRRRIRGLMARARQRLRRKGSDKERRDRRGVIIGGVAGALALAGIAILGISSNGSQNNEKLSLSPAKTKPLTPKELHHVSNKARHDVSIGTNTGGATHKAHQKNQAGSHQNDQVQQKQRTIVEVSPNRNPWDISKQQLELHGVVHPGIAQIQHYNERLLRLNHITADQAHYIFSGTKLKIPKIK